MTHRRSSIAIAIAVGLLVAASAQAQVVAQDCTDCTTAQIEAMAPPCGQGYAYISDFGAPNLYKLCYTLDVNDGYQPPRREKEYQWAQPEATYENTFQAYLAVYNNNGHVKAIGAKSYLRLTLRPKVNVGGDDGYMNAYDTVRSSANNQVVLNWLDSTTFSTGNTEAYVAGVVTPALTSATVALLNAIKTAVISFNIKISVTLVFNDGSQRTYTVGSSGAWETVPNTAMDAHFNRIPESASTVANNGGSETYGFGGYPTYDQTNLSTLISLYGIPVTYGGTSGEIICTWDSIRNNLHCILPN